MKSLINAFYKGLDKLTYVFLSVAYSVLIVILSIQVFSRFVFSFPFMWAEEFTRYLFIWITYIGAGVAFSKGGHLAVDAISSKFPFKLRYTLDIVFNIVVICFAAFVAYQGFLYSGINIHKPFYSTKMLNLGTAYLAIPIGCCIMIINILRELYKLLTMGDNYYKNRRGVF